VVGVFVAEGLILHETGLENGATHDEDEVVVAYKGLADGWIILLAVVVREDEALRVVAVGNVGRGLDCYLVCLTYM
jgi:hypothetical protein